MMQNFRISDALRCILLNAPQGPNLACPRSSLYSPPTLRNARLWKDTLAQRNDRIAQFQWDGIRLQGLVSARMLGGCRVWEIDRLFLPGLETSTQDYYGTSWETTALQLLEQVVEVAGWRNAERVFLRLPLDSQLVRAARRAGFFPCFAETLMEYSGQTGDSITESLAQLLQPRSPEDAYALFQLFTSTTPAPVRLALGVTFDQWRDSQEPGQSGGKEWVSKTNGKIAGWLRCRQRRHWRDVELMFRPERPELLTFLMRQAMCQGERQRWLVPEYQEAVKDALREREFQEVTRYIMLIKTVAIPVLQPGIAAVEA